MRSTAARRSADVADRLHSAAIHLLRALRRQDDASGLSASRLSALSVIVFGGPVTISQLARAEQVSTPTMTRMLAGMQSDGFVKRERDATDRRVIWIRPTAKGARVLQEGRTRRVAALASDLAGLETSQLDVLARAADLMEQMSGRSSPADNPDATGKPTRRR